MVNPSVPTLGPVESLRCPRNGPVFLTVAPTGADTFRMALGESFASVLAAAQAGSDWGWDRLYRELAGPLLGYLRSRGAREPEDLLGEVLLQLARNIGTFRGDEAAFRSWAFLVAHHRLLDERRALGRRRDDPVQAHDLEQLGGVGDAEAEAMERLTTARVRELVSRLTPDQQDVLLLRILGDLTVGEAARILGKREGAVKALQRRALAALHREIRGERVPL